MHLTLDPVFERFPDGGTVIDPACGSGAFLVEAFRRLVWRASAGRPASRDTVRKVLREQLFGIDINRSALGIAAFSLYLAALELDEDPIEDLGDLKFNRLIGRTLFEADSLGPLPSPIAMATFAAVVGNPPWTFVSQAGKPVVQPDEPPRPRRSPDWAFLNLAARLAGETGRVGMVMKATPFFSKDGQAVAARSDLLQRMAPTALINLSYLRRERLFPDAVGPALLFLARCALSTADDRLLVGSIPWTPDFQRTGVFHVGPSEIRSADQVDTVLDLVCRGVENARQHVTPGMFEVPTTSVVRKAIRRVKKSLGLTNLQVRGEHEVDDMATNYPAILGRIDITLQFLHQFGDEDAFVAVECKRVEPGNSVLSAGYVAEGVNRFATGKYAAGHHWGFMLGYVLALPVDTIVAAIDQRVQKAYGSDAALAPIAAHPLALGVFGNVVAQSAEHRIRLRHIFVDMLVAAPSAAVP